MCARNILKLRTFLSPTKKDHFITPSRLKYNYYFLNNIYIFMFIF